MVWELGSRPTLKFGFRIEAFSAGGKKGETLRKEPTVKSGLRFHPPPFSCLFSTKMRNSGIGRVKCGFASLARKGSWACLGLGGAEGGAQCPEVGGPEAVGTV